MIVDRSRPLPLVRLRIVQLCCVAVAMAVAFAVAVSPAAAQTSSSSTPQYDVQLVSQSAYVLAGQPFTMTLDIDGAEPTDQIKVDIWGRERGPASRREVREVVGGRAPDDRELGLFNLYVYSATYGQAVDPATGYVTITIPQDRANDDPGVYPLTVRIDRGRKRSETLLTTTLVRSGQVGEGGRLDVAFVLPAAAGLAHRANGSVVVDADDRARLRAMTTLFTSALSSMPLTIEPRPETLDALVALAQSGDAAAGDLLSAIQTMATGRQVLPSSYVPADEEALRRRDLDTLVGQLESAGLRAIQAMGLAPVNSAAQVSRIDPTDTVDTLAMRQDFGTDLLLVPDRALEPLDPDRFPATLLQSFVLESSAGDQMPALVTDDYLADLAAQLDDASRAAERPLLAQRFLADLVAGYSDEPESVRGAVVVLPEDFDVRATGIAEMLTALSSVPELRLTTVDELAADVSAAAPLGGGRRANDNSELLVRQLRPANATDLGTYPARVLAAERSLNGLESIAPGTTSALERLRLISADTSLDAEGRAAYLSAVASGVEAGLRAPDGGPALDGPGSQRVTMTSRRATIPIQITNRMSTPVHVRIELESEKLDFPDGWLRETTLAPGPNTIEVEVEAKTSGDSLLEVTILPPDASSGLGTLATGSFTVRSTALSGVGLAISIVALAVLVVWWARHVLRSRRARAQAKPEDAPTSDEVVARNGAGESPRVEERTNGAAVDARAMEGSAIDSSALDSSAIDASTTASLTRTEK